MIERSTIEAALAAGLGGGADFAEVFVEDRRSTSALLDDGRVEDLTSGRDRGAGVRGGRGHHRLRAHRRPEPGGPRRGSAARLRCGGLAPRTGPWCSATLRPRARAAG
ncbi:MAG: DNA gyrase modulator [Microthrixaceae bacterium]